MRSTDGIEDGIDPGGELVQCVDEVTVAVVDGLRPTPSTTGMLAAEDGPMAFSPKCAAGPAAPCPPPSAATLHRRTALAATGRPTPGRRP